MKSSRTPAVSVVMSVFNGSQHIGEAVESILNQTFRDFEFIIIDDGSTDNTSRLLAGYSDSRIHIFTQNNQGLVASLNSGLAKAKGSYIARMDADDISLPHRLEQQVDYLESHPNCSIVGTSLNFIDDSGKVLFPSPLLLLDNDIRLEMLVRCPFAHGSVMFRKDEAMQIAGYRQSYWPAEDYDLWRRLSALGTLANLPDLLFSYRLSDKGISLSNQKLQKEQTDKVRMEIWSDSSLLNTPSSYSVSYYRYNDTYAGFRLARLAGVYLKASSIALGTGYPRLGLAILWKLVGSPVGAMATAKYIVRKVKPKK